MQNHQETVFDRRGNVIPNCQVRVTTLDGTLAALFSDNAGTPLANPVTTNEEGQAFFYAANGHYNITTIREAVEVDLRTDVTLFDPDDLQVLEDTSIVLFTPEGMDTLLGMSSILRPAAAATPATNGELVFELTNNSTLTIKVRGSDGAVRVGTLNLV